MHALSHNVNVYSEKFARVLCQVPLRLHLACLVIGDRSAVHALCSFLPRKAQRIAVRLVSRPAAAVQQQQFYYSER